MMKGPPPTSQLLEFATAQQFDDELARLFEDSEIADDAAQTIEWALIRKPDRGYPVPRTPVWIYPVVVFGLEYVVYYRWEEVDKVELLSIRTGVNE